MEFGSECVRSRQVYSQRALSGPFLTGVVITADDVMEVRVTGNTVEYLRNNEVFYTSTKAPTFPLHVDAALSSLNSAAGDVTVHACSSA